MSYIHPCKHAKVFDPIAFPGAKIRDGDTLWLLPDVAMTTDKNGFTEAFCLTCLVEEMGGEDRVGKPVKNGQKKCKSKRKQRLR